MSATATAKKSRAPEMPDPVAIVRFYRNPADILREYIESDFARELATEHERKVQVLAAEGAAVSDAASFARVGERLVDIAGHRKDVEGWFKPIKDFAFRLHRMICDRENEVLRPLNAFERTAKDNAQGWQREQERLRREEEQRLQEEARQREQERLAREAEQLEQRGEPELAAQVLEQAIHTPAPVFALPSTVPDVKGMSFRENWKWRPIGGDTPQARARAVNLVPREYLCLDEKKLNAYAKAHGAGARIPGIEFYDAGSVSVRA
jgi:hypothetical protein